MKFLGTGAAEGIPNPFCNCRVCQNAREKKGNEIRTRSSFMLNNKVIIDMGADYFAQSVMCGVSFTNIEHILFTHTHDDHFNYTLFWEKFVAENDASLRLKVYMTDEAMGVIEDFYMNSHLTDGREEFIKNIDFVPLKYGERYHIDSFWITPLKGRHETPYEKNSANFLIENNGKTLFYGLDSGYFLPETVSALVGKRLDVIITECTFPAECGISEKNGHMDLPMCLNNLDRLYGCNAIDNHTAVYLSHIGSTGMTHSELQAAAENINRPYKVIVAFDGMELEM